MHGAIGGDLADVVVRRRRVERDRVHTEHVPGDGAADRDVSGLRAELVDLGLHHAWRPGAREHGVCAGNLDAGDRRLSFPQSHNGWLELRLNRRELAVARGRLRARARHSSLVRNDHDLAGHSLAVEQAHEVIGARRRAFRDLHRELLVPVEPAAVVEGLLAGERRLRPLRALRLPGSAGVEKARIRGGLSRVTGTLRQEERQLSIGSE